jgi:hypothetical protein
LAFSNRPDIVTGQYRLLLAHTRQSGWWYLADPQLWVDYRYGTRVQFNLEGEVGKMIGKTTGVWIRGGGQVASSDFREAWNLGAGIRFIFF